MTDQSSERRTAAAPQVSLDVPLRHLLDALPLGAYTCDRNGLITYFNPQAEALWQRAPALNDPASRFCGSWRMFAADGTPIAPEDSWTAKVLKTGREQAGIEAIIQRSDGSQINVLVHAKPIVGADGLVAGAINTLVDITDHKQGDKARALLAAIVDSSADAIISKTLDGTITSWNLGAERMFGHTAAEAIGQPITMIVPPDRLDEEHSIIEHISRGERVEHSETVRIAKGGRPIDVSVTVSPVHDTTGRIIGASAVTRNIARRKRAENALRETESRFQTLTRNAPAAIFVKDRDGRYTVANPLACEALGRPEGVVGHTDHDLLPAETADALRETDLEVVSSGQPVKREELVRRPGFDRTYLSVKFPLAQDGGRVEGVCGVSIDITDRKRAEEALLESEERFRMLADNIAQLAWMADATGAIFWYNQRWFEYTGTTLDEMQGWGWQAVHAPEHVDRVTEKYTRCFAHGEVWEDTFPLRGADGQYRWFLSRAIPIRGADGQVLRWFGTNTDITAQRDAEEALRVADRRKDEFLAMLAHELRNPLAPISNSLHILRMAEDVDPAVQNVHEVLERQTHHLSRLVDDLLEVSRITQGKIELRKQQVELAAVVRSAVETSRPFIDAGDHQLAITLPSEPVLLNADPTRLSQAVANLLTNAAKYTPSGGQIWLIAETHNGDAVIRVRDNGIGIAPALIPRVFEKFAQGSGADARNGGGGLGIGLTLARNMVELHGGVIEAHSDGPGQGSQFTIQLPIGTGAPKPPQAGRGSQRAGSDEKCQRRVLIVDDARDSSFILSKLLEMLGHKVFTADNGLDAIEIARSERPDVVFSDIAMAQMDGIELARRLRKEPGLEAIVLIALTGFGQDSDRALTEEAGFNLHLVKPVSPEQIEQALGAVGKSSHVPAD